MNDRNESLIEAGLERLVDGELAGEEYGALLAALEEEPGGWRGCAMACLEAQALAKELEGIRQLAAGRVGMTVTRPSHSEPGWEKFRMLLAIAAGFMIAVGLGLVAPNLFRWGRQENVAGGNIQKQLPVALAEDPD